MHWSGWRHHQNGHLQARTAAEGARRAPGCCWQHHHHHHHRHQTLQLQRLLPAGVWPPHLLMPLLLPMLPGALSE